MREMLYRPLSRRAFLRLSGLYTLAAVAAACAPTPKPTTAPVATPSPIPSADLADPPFGLWRALLNEVRASPDHLGRAADAAVATRDPEAIFTFVRDNIATYPPDARAFSSGTEYVVRWGSRGVLRGGAGTPRERADLLAELFARAGFPARVVAGSSTLTADQVRTALLRSVQRDFLPSLDLATLADWRQQSGLAPSPSPDPATPDVLATMAGAITAPLLAALPSDLPMPPAFDATPGLMPYVEVTIDGQVRAADTFLPDATFGTAYVSGSSSEPVTVAAPGIHLELAITTCAAPATPRTVLTADWKPGDLVGRQVVLGFAPAGQMAAILATAPLDMHVFTPTAMVQAVDATDGFIKELTVAGTAITTGGETIVAGTDGSLSLDGRPLVSGPADPTAAARVAQVTITVNASAFPIVELGVTPTDAAGATVDGLDVTAFSTTENGVARLGFLERGIALPPRVLMVFDSTGSIPDAFNGAARTSLALALFDGLAALHPGLEASATSLQGAASWTADRAALEAQLGAIGLVAGSELWLAAADASRAGADAVIFVTDGQANDTQSPAIQSILEAGPPIIALNVGDPTGQPTLDAMAALSGGLARPVQAAASAIQVATEAVDARVHALPRYRLRYRAITTGPASRAVEVQVPAGGAMARGTYEAPTIRPAAAGPALASIRLTLAMGSVQVDRLLAGYGGSDPEAIVTPVERDEAWAALFGTTLLSFEGAAPTASQLLDDALTARLAGQSYYEAMRGTDPKSQVATFSRGFPGLPAPLLNLLSPLPDPDGQTMTFELGPRVVLCAVNPLAGGGTSSRVDILPATRFASVGPDGRSAFEATARRTAYLAAIEGVMYDASTAGLLSGKALRTVGPYARLSSGGNLSASQQALLDAAESDRSYDAFVRYVWDDDTVPPPYWAIEPSSGTLFGVLPDGSGGGEGESHYTNEEALEQVDRWIALANVANEFWIEGIPQLAMSWVIAVYLEAARAYILAGAQFNHDPGGEGPPPPKLPCNAGKAAIKFGLHHAFHQLKPVLVGESAFDATGFNPLAC